MAVDLEPQSLELLFVCDGGRLPGETGQDNTAYEQTVGSEGVHEAEQVHVVGDTQIAADLILLDIARIDDDHDLHLFAQRFQHCDLGIRRKTGKNSGGMIIIEKFASELQIKLASELGDPLLDVTGLCL